MSKPSRILCFVLVLLGIPGLWILLEPDSKRDQEEKNAEKHMPTRLKGRTERQEALTLARVLTMRGDVLQKS